MTKDYPHALDCMSRRQVSEYEHAFPCDCHVAEIDALRAQWARAQWAQHQYGINELLGKDERIRELEQQVEEAQVEAQSWREFHAEKLKGNAVMERLLNAEQLEQQLKAAQERLAEAEETLRQYADQFKWDSFSGKPRLWRASADGTKPAKEYFAKHSNRAK